MSMARKLTKLGINKVKSQKLVTKMKAKIVKSKKKLTKEQQKKHLQEIQKQEGWVTKQVTELKNSQVWNKMYFTTWEGYVKILGYENINSS